MKQGVILLIYEALRPFNSIQLERLLSTVEHEGYLIYTKKAKDTESEHVS
jgi:hypothetical protein